MSFRKCSSGGCAHGCQRLEPKPSQLDSPFQLEDLTFWRLWSNDCHSPTGDICRPFSWLRKRPDQKQPEPGLLTSWAAHTSVASSRLPTKWRQASSARLPWASRTCFFHVFRCHPISASSFSTDSGLFLVFRKKAKETVAKLQWDSLSPWFPTHF